MRINSFFVPIAQCETSVPSLFRADRIIRHAEVLFYSLCSRTQDVKKPGPLVDLPSKAQAPERRSISRATLGLLSGVQSPERCSGLVKTGARAPKSPAIHQCATYACIAYAYCILVLHTYVTRVYRTRLPGFFTLSRAIRMKCRIG
jgi:hypothetical protein